MQPHTFAQLCSRAHTVEAARATCCLLLGQQSRAEHNTFKKFSVDSNTFDTFNIIIALHIGNLSGGGRGKNLEDFFGESKAGKLSTTETKHIMHA